MKPYSFLFFLSGDETEEAERAPRKRKRADEQISLPLALSRLPSGTLRKFRFPNLHLHRKQPLYDAIVVHRTDGGDTLCLCCGAADLSAKNKLQNVLLSLSKQNLYLFTVCCFILNFNKRIISLVFLSDGVCIKHASHMQL